jgi:PEP-CTERM motif
MKKWKHALSAIALGVASFGTLAAPAVLDTGLVQMGVSDYAGLGEAGTGLVGGSGDAITPGCLCEGWGASASGAAGYTYGGGRTGMSAGLLTVGAGGTTGAGLDASSVVTMTNGLRVTHTYSYAADGRLFKVHVTLTNTTGATLTDVRYARTLDWDVPPGHFSDDFTTVFKGAAPLPAGNLLHTSTNPFAVPNPLVTRSQDADINITDTPGDKGSYFIFGFGSIDAGASHEFDTFIGSGRNTADLLDAFSDVGVAVYSYTFDDDTFVTYGYGFAGVGIPPIDKVPEPGTLALSGLALAGLALARRRKRA